MLTFKSTKAEFQKRFDSYTQSRGNLENQIRSVSNRLETLRKVSMAMSQDLYQSFLLDIEKRTPSFIDGLTLSHSVSRFADESQKRRLFIEIRDKFDAWLMDQYNQWLRDVWIKDYLLFETQTKELGEEAKKLHQILVDIQNEGTSPSILHEQQDTSDDDYNSNDDLSTGACVAIIAGAVIIGLPLAVASLPFLPFYFLGKWIYGAKKGEENTKKLATERIIEDLKDSTPERVLNFLAEVGRFFADEHKAINDPLSLKLREIDKEFRDKQHLLNSDRSKIDADRKKLENFQSSVLSLQSELDSCIAFLQSV